MLAYNSVPLLNFQEVPIPSNTKDRGLVLVSAGATIGVLASFGLTRFIENMLFGVTPTDPLTFVAIVALLGFVALLACLIPAQRAMRVDPIVVLRHQ